MPPAMPPRVGAERKKDEEKYQKGVKHLCENGIDKVPTKYIVPISERPANITASSINLPVVDFAQLQDHNRSQLIHTLSEACQEYGFFQLINHGIDRGVIGGMRDVSKRFFEQPFEERQKHMTSDMYSPVRYGTSFNQNKDGVFCWRDFLKLSCLPLLDFLSLWPSSPQDLREVVSEYSTQTRLLYLRLMEAILESLGVITQEKEEEEHDVDGREFLKEIENGNQIMVMNLYPPCPEPDLTLGLPPHSDYGLLTLLLQDEQVEGLQIHHQGKWLNVKPIPNSYVVNIGDQLEIYSNGRYKSVLHRVLVNSFNSRISVVSLHSLNVESIVRPSPKLVDKFNPPLYKETDFAAFLDHLSSSESKGKSFLESRML